MKILFHLGHPAHFHLFNPVIKKLMRNGHSVVITIKEKDVLFELLQSEKLPFVDILPEGRVNTFFSLVVSVFRKAKNLLQVVNEFKPDMMIGTSAEIGFIGLIKSIRSIVVNEDDWSKVPLFTLISYPFCTNILSPQCCNTGIWSFKKISYNGYHELAYLSPKYFQPDRSRVKCLLSNNEKYFIIRLVKMTSHHDFGKTGMTDEIVQKIIDILKPFGDIYISSERELATDLEQYRLIIPPENIHHALYYADMIIGDSETMIAEAAVLGTPSVRFNDFICKSGYLHDLEYKYKITYGICTKKVDKFYTKVKELLMMKNKKSVWEHRRDKMLSEQIEVTDFFIWLLEEFPESVNLLKGNPQIMYQFK